MIGVAAVLLGAAAAAIWTPVRVRATALRRTRIPWSALGVGLGLFVVVGGPWGVGAGTLGAALAARRTRAPGRESDDRWAGAAPVVAELIAAATRAGVPPVVAVRAIADALGPTPGDGLLRAAERWRYGLSAVGDDLDRPTRLIAQAVERAQDSGAAPAGALEHAAAELAADTMALAQERARRVGVQAAVPLGVCLLPAFLCMGVVPLVASLMTGFAR